MVRGQVSMHEWRRLLPRARLNVARGGRIPTEQFTGLPNDGVHGIWGYTQFQHGIDGLPHWGAPWGLFYVAEPNVKVFCERLAS
jgi:hypothetical protein